MAKFQQIKETTYQESAPRVDAAAGVIYGVKLLGRHSKNGREYTEAAMKKAVASGLYEGRKIYVDHPKREDMGNDRPFRSWAGESRNPVLKPDGIYGDVHLRQKGDYFEGIIEAAEKFPKSVGFSHVADGEGRLDRGTEIIESITEVFSVDLVTDPATTAGFFESHQPKTLKTALESLPEGPVRKRLLEMVNLGTLDGTAAIGDGEPADPLTQMSSLVKELITMLGETLKALAMKKDDPAPAPAPTTPIAPKAEATPAADPVVPGKAVEPTVESLQRENAELKAKTQLLESGREAKPVWVKALAGIGDDAAQKEFMDSLPVIESAGGERPHRSPALVEASQVGATDFDSPEKFAARYR